jgi:hypothetical protein
MTPSDPNDPTQGEDATVSPLDELRERLRPRSLQGGGDPGVTAGERFALERVQALELQVATTHQRERELLELAVKDGNQIASLSAQVATLGDLAARAETAERAIFEAESRAEGAVRRSELMENELMSTRAEVDRLRTRIVELEASLRRALAEIGEATSGRHAPAAEDDVAAQEDAAARSLELADRLRLKVVDLEASLRSVVSSAGEQETQRLLDERADEEELAAEIHRAAEIASATATAASDVRLADLEARLAALDSRIAGLSEAMAPAPEEDVVVDLREEDEEPQILEDLPTEPIKPPASRWSDWRTT